MMVSCVCARAHRPFLFDRRKKGKIDSLGDERLKKNENAKKRGGAMMMRATN